MPLEPRFSLGGFPYKNKSYRKSWYPLILTLSTGGGEKLRELASGLGPVFVGPMPWTCFGLAEGLGRLSVGVARRAQATAAGGYWRWTRCAKGNVQGVRTSMHSPATRGFTARVIKAPHAERAPFTSPHKSAPAKVLQSEPPGLPWLRTAACFRGIQKVRLPWTTALRGDFCRGKQSPRACRQRDSTH